MQKKYLQEKLKEFLFSSSKLTADFIIAKTILDNLDNFPDFYLKEIAIEAQVAESTVTKFCHKLGYDGFKDLRDDIINEENVGNIDELIENITEATSPNELINVISKNEKMFMKQATLFFDDEKMAQIGSLIKEKKHGMILAPVYLYETIKTLEEFLWRKNYNFYHLLRNTDETILTECSEDGGVILVFSIKGEWVKNEVEKLKELKAANQTIIVFTCSEKVTSEYVDLFFHIGDEAIVANHSAFIQYIYFRYLCIYLISKC